MALPNHLRFRKLHYLRRTQGLSRRYARRNSLGVPFPDNPRPRNHIFLSNRRQVLAVRLIQLHYCSRTDPPKSGRRRARPVRSAPFPSGGFAVYHVVRFQPHTQLGYGRPHPLALPVVREAYADNGDARRGFGRLPPLYPSPYQPRHASSRPGRADKSVAGVASYHSG
jgi:hypothetical protein